MKVSDEIVPCKVWTPVVQTTEVEPGASSSENNHSYVAGIVAAATGIVHILFYTYSDSRSSHSWRGDMGSIFRNLETKTTTFGHCGKTSSDKQLERTQFCTYVNRQIKHPL